MARNLQHPGLHAKRYDESQDRWQARVNDDWRFYFTIEGDAYLIRDIALTVRADGGLRQTGL